MRAPARSRSSRWPDEVGVKMGQEHMGDVQLVARGEVEILVDVPLWVHNGRGLRGVVADQVRGMRQAIQIELLEDHGALLAVIIARSPIMQTHP